MQLIFLVEEGLICVNSHNICHTGHQDMRKSFFSKEVLQQGTRRTLEIFKTHVKMTICWEPLCSGWVFFTSCYHWSFFFVLSSSGAWQWQAGCASSPSEACLPGMIPLNAFGRVLVWSANVLVVGCWDITHSHGALQAREANGITLCQVVFH